MSKAYAQSKNFTFKTMMNLMCYGAKEPHTLTQNQKVTRLYRATLRRLYAFNLEGYRPEHEEFQRSITLANQDFKTLLNLQPNSHEYNLIAQKYETWLSDNYDPNGVVEECRPYASTSGRYYVWSDEVLGFDPFGYYSGSRLVSEKRPDEYFPYFELYPMNDTKWGIGELFDIDFDATDYERLDILKKKGTLSNQSQEF